MAAESGFSVTTADGFAIESNPRGGIICRQHGEPYPVPGQRFEHVEIIESLAKEIERLRGDGQAVWHPIETAPKDGTRIDLYAYFPASRERSTIRDCLWSGSRWEHNGIEIMATATHWCRINSLIPPSGTNRSPTPARLRTPA